MAATLALIKSKLLLPVPESIEDEEDPRAELVRRLQEYQRIKQAAQQLDELPRLEREYWSALVEAEQVVDEKQMDTVDLSQLVQAFQATLKKQAVYEHHHIQQEAISTQDKISAILTKLSQSNTGLSLQSLIVFNEGRQGVLVTFLAILELIKGQQVRLVNHVESTANTNEPSEDSMLKLTVELLK